MSRRAILALAGAFSAFVLVLAGAAAAHAWRPAPTTSAKAPDAIPVDVVRAREASYMRLIEEANARLRAEQAASAATAPERTPVGATSRSDLFGEGAEREGGHHRHDGQNRAPRRGRRWLRHAAQVGSPCRSSRWWPTVAGWLAMVVRGAPVATEAEMDPLAELPPIPTLEPASEIPRAPARRPVPAATTRSSR